jgi:hypothetical protein
MRRLVLLLVCACALVALVPAAAPGARLRQVDLPRLFAADLAEVKATSGVPVLVPQFLPSRARRHVPSTSAEPGSYALALGAVRNCGGATACFIASFEAERGARPDFRRTVELTGGRTGYFKPLSCGASCSPPVVQFVEGGVLYTIAANVGTKATERKLLVRMANSAIKRGPR